MMDGKKFSSFSFNKNVKKVQILKPTINKTNDHELIECLEGKSIKIVGKDDNQKPNLLVIPMKSDQRIINSRAIQQIIREEQGLENESMDDVETNTVKSEDKSKIHENETLDQKATREILNSLKNEEVENETKVFSLPLKPEDLPLDGAKEATLDDYENIPIQDFGMAMLRGMGFKDEPKKKNEKLNLPVFRPKGMGLGADKIIKPKPLIAPANDEVLEIKKNANVRILAGKFKDLYGQIEGLDEDSGRIIVKLSIGGNRESLNEFMVLPVSKQEYIQYAKVLNSVKYQEYKIKDEEKSERYKESTSRNEIEIIHKIKSETEIESRYKINKTETISDSSDDDDNNEKNISKSKSNNNRRRRSRSNSRSNQRSSRNKSSDNSDYEDKKKKSHKSHKTKNKHSEKDRSRSRDRSRKKYSSDEEKYHKKKTKKSKKPRSRSKTRK